MAAQCIRDRVKWLDAVDFVSRQTLIERLNEPDFAIALAPDNRQSATGDGEDGVVHPFLRSALQTLLGTEYPFRILTNDPQSPFIKVHVRLRDGSWIDMHYHRGDETEAWPSHLTVQLLILVISVLGLSLTAVSWVTNPLIRLANAADELGKDMHRTPLDETGSLEVRRAAHAFNTMKARLVSYIQD
ncbi:HAMP domain-containing protein [Candidatus Methylobacter favarea]|nr:HAMP domain-containing protein [Candidatus Methylobacter favarea]